MTKLTPADHAAMLRLLKNMVGCIHHPDAGKVWDGDTIAPQKIVSAISKIAQITSITPAEILQYTKRSGVIVVERGGKYSFSKDGHHD